MIAILNVEDVTGDNVSYDIVDYDATETSGSTLAAVRFEGQPPEASIQVMTEEEFETFKQGSIWGAE